MNLAIRKRQDTGGGGSDRIRGFENIQGSEHADRLLGDDGANAISGGSGDDVIHGGEGPDRLSGGTGADVFRYGAALEAGLGGGSHDVITDYGSGDRIDLAAIDADDGRRRDQAFRYIGSDPFTASAQLRYAIDSGVGDSVGWLEGNTGGDLSPEFQIALLGAPELQAADFIL